MQPYANLSGASAVEAFEIADDAILVRFRDGAVYRYDAARPGPAAVRRMGMLAQEGRGLARYIRFHVGTAFAEKLVAPVRKRRRREVEGPRLGLRDALLRSLEIAQAPDDAPIGAVGGKSGGEASGPGGAGDPGRPAGSHGKSGGAGGHGHRRRGG